jgi:hypothetical protein
MGATAAARSHQAVRGAHSSNGTGVSCVTLSHDVSTTINQLTGTGLSTGVGTGTGRSTGTWRKIVGTAGGRRHGQGTAWQRTLLRSSTRHG